MHTMLKNPRGGRNSKDRGQRSERQAHHLFVASIVIDRTNFPLGVKVLCGCYRTYDVLREQGHFCNTCTLQSTATYTSRSSALNRRRWSTAVFGSMVVCQPAPFYLLPGWCWLVLNLLLYVVGPVYENMCP